jgi:putative ATP-dependent endonuclease of the OLD family
VLLIEEPELYLRPQAQRYLYRLLRVFAEMGNQVVYTTDAPAFLNVGRLDELVFVRQDPNLGVRTRQPRLDPAEHDFRYLTEFDAERSELFLARAALLVEGATEKLAFPFIFRALGHDPDREAISIVECGGKSNIPLFARVCAAAGIPHVAVHDRDAPLGRRPIASEREANRAIAEVVGARHTVELAPDFEQVAGLRSHRHKPEHAWQRFGSTNAHIPERLAQAVRLVVSLARD